MDGLRIARVLVLDNEIDEAKPFMEALAKRGVGATYFSGDVEKLPCPNQKLTGIRLAVLDLDLTGEREAKAAIGTLLQSVNAIIGRDNGPYLAIAWTGTDDEFFSEFVKQQRNLECRPIKVIKMSKADYDFSARECRQIEFPSVKPLHFRHSRESGNPESPAVSARLGYGSTWIPASAGMTR